VKGYFKIERLKRLCKKLSEKPPAEPWFTVEYVSRDRIRTTDSVLIQRGDVRELAVGYSGDRVRIKRH